MEEADADTQEQLQAKKTEIMEQRVVYAKRDIAIRNLLERIAAIAEREILAEWAIFFRKPKLPCAILGLVLLYAWRSDPPGERAPIQVELEAEQGKLPQRKTLTTPSPAAGIKAVVQPGDLIKPGTMRHFLLGAEADNQHKTLIFR